VNCPHAATIGDLARLGALEGRRVRFLAEDIPYLVPKGTIGVVSWVSSEPKALVDFVREDYHDGHPWKHVHLETRLFNLELVAE
jgi:hypothetical protein